jgi:hypothetical protein
MLSSRLHTLAHRRPASLGRIVSGKPGAMLYCATQNCHSTTPLLLQPSESERRNALLAASNCTTWRTERQRSAQGGHLNHTAGVYSSRPRHRQMTGEGSRPGSGHALKKLQTMHRLHKQGRVNGKRTPIGRHTLKRALKEDSGQRCVPRGSREAVPEAERFPRPLRARLTTRLAVRSSIRCTPSCCVDEGYL